MNARILLTLGVIFGLAAAVRATPVELPTVGHVDLSRYVGTWYEIARYPNRFERDCDRDVTAQYSMRSDGQIRVVNECTTAQGKIKRSVGSALVVDTTTNAKLKVTFFWPFYGKYWIIDLGQNYEYAVVGEPSREYLWILSRSAEMPDSTYQQIERRLSALAYDGAKLVRTKQTKTAASGPS